MSSPLLKPLTDRPNLTETALDADSSDGITVRTKQHKAGEAEARREARPAAVAASIPVGRYDKPRECGQPVAFLANPADSCLTGSAIRADGGPSASV
jgi:NAD(P)-dependent dehydrogenase (short-subunit alcohol dehydrogenase family)